MSYIGRLPFADGMKLLAKAFEKRLEEAVYQQWLSVYPEMVTPRIKQQKGNQMTYVPALKFVSFSDYLSRYKMPDISKRPAAEILAKAAEIRKRIAEKKAGKGGEST